MSNVHTISAEAAASIFSADEINRAKQSQDGFLGVKGDMTYYLNIEFTDFHINMGTVEVVDQMGEGNNRGGRPRYDF
jgi:hypothetical protein